MKFSELEIVKTLKEYPKVNLKKGEIGVIVATFSLPNEAYEVEFVNNDGSTKAIFSIYPDDLEKL